MMNNELFKNKHVLLDVNILSEMANAKRAVKFRPVFEFLKKEGSNIFVLDATYFEFVGFTNNKTDYDFLKKFFALLPVAPTQKQDIELATLLSSVYKNKNPDINPKQISFCDCLYAAQIIKYQGRAFLVTTDIYDYPFFVFDIAKLMVIDDNGKAKIVALITFNKNKWENAKEHFERSGAKLIS